MGNRCYLTVQLGSYESGSKVLGLLLFPGSMPLPGEYKISVRRWSEGKSSRAAYDSFEGFTTSLIRMGRMRFNWVEAAFRFAPFTLKKSDIKILSMKSRFDVSPSNSLWGNVYGYLLDGRSAEATRSFLENREISLRWNGIDRFPSLLTCQIDFEPGPQSGEPAAVWADIIAGNIPPQLSDMDIFGCADVTGRELPLGLLDKLAPCPKTYEYLDVKFDGLHDMLIGERALCRALSERLRDTASYMDLGKKGEEGHGLVVIENHEDISEPEIEEFLVRKDAGTAARHIEAEDEERGDYRIGQRVFHTRRRMTELIEKRLMPTCLWRPRRDPDSPLETWTFFALVKKEYLPALGVNPDDVLLDGHQEGFMKEFENDIDRNYRESDDIKEEKKRIWIAHEQTYKKYEYPPQLRALLKRLYF